MHAGRQDGEAKYIWLDWLKYEQNRGNRVSYVYLCVFVNSLKKKKKKKKRKTLAKQPNKPSISVHLEPCSKCRNRETWVRSQGQGCEGLRPYTSY